MLTVFAWPLTAGHCLSLAIRRLSMSFHCLCVASHCRSLPFHVLSLPVHCLVDAGLTVFAWPLIRSLHWTHIPKAVSHWQWKHKPKAVPRAAPAWLFPAGRPAVVGEQPTGLPPLLPDSPDLRGTAGEARLGPAAAARKETGCSCRQSKALQHALLGAQLRAVEQGLTLQPESALQLQPGRDRVQLQLLQTVEQGVAARNAGP